MDFDLLIALLKVVGALVGGILGAAAIFSNFHNTATGKLSAWGKAVLAGIIVSSLVGVVTSIVETWKARNEAQEQTAKTEKILQGISRGLQPITELKMNTWFEIQQGNKVVDSYIRRLRAGISDRSAALIDPMHPRQSNKSLKGLDAWARDADGNILNVEISPESDLWPKRPDEAAISSALLVSSFSIYILRMPIDPQNFEPGFGKTDFGAFSFNFGGARLAWDVRHQRLEIVEKIEFPKELWSTNGVISSIEDLKGSQIFILTGSSSDYTPKFPTVSPNTSATGGKEISRSLFPRSVNLNLGGGRSVQIYARNWKKTKYLDGYPAFSVVLPTDDAGLARFGQENEK